MTRFAALLFVLALIPPALLAGEDAGSASPFRFGFGARELALGTASIVDAEPTVAAHWNAAALARAEYFGVSGFHSRLLADGVSYQHFGLAIPTLDFGTIGIGVARLAVTDIERRDNANMPLGAFDDSRFAINLGYARQIGRYDLGFALTIEHHSIDSYRSTSSPGLNLALSRRIYTDAAWLPEMSATIVGHNLIAPSMRLATETESYEATGEFGIGATLVPISALDLSLSLYGRAARSQSGADEIAGGMEADIGGLLTLRSGVNDGQMSFGGGISARFLRFNYALVERDLGLVHTFDITMNFGTSLGRRRDNREQTRENQFRDRMNNFVASNNGKMIDDLMRAGRSAVDSGQFAQATAAFDRALFLARSSELDTVTIQQLLTESRRRYDAQQLESTFRQSLDLARSSLESSDYIGAKYAATQALELKPDDSLAQEFAQLADSALSTAALRAQSIEEKLDRADSLLLHENPGGAMAEVRGLAAVAGGDARVANAVQRIEFAFWRDRTIREQAVGNLARAQQALDSAAARYPDHQWCASMRKLLRRPVEAAETAPPVPAKIVSPQPNEGSVREAAQEYEAGKISFEKGELDRAVQHWERAELLVPNYLAVRDHLIRAYKFVGVDLYGKGRLEEAAAIWRKALRFAPENAEISGYIRRAEAEIVRMQELSYGQ